MGTSVGSTDRSAGDAVDEPDGDSPDSSPGGGNSVGGNSDGDSPDGSSSGGGTETGSDLDRGRPPRFPPAARATAVFVIVMAALVVAIWPRGDGTDGAGGGDAARSADRPNIADAPVDPSQVAAARRDAALADCPATGLPAAPGAALAGIRVPCLATGSTYDLAAGTAGRPLVINMWAVWCLPCRRELPDLAAFADRAGDRVSVLAAHAQQGAQNPFLALTFLREVGVHVPTVLDTDGAIAAAVKAPRVYPSTVLVRADGTVAKVLPQVFDDPDQIADAVREYLGVAT